MSEKKADYILIRQQLGKNPDQQISEKIRDAAHHNNSYGCRTSVALSELNVSNIEDSVVGPNCIGILDTTGQVYRFLIEQKSASKVVKEEPCSNSSNSDVVPSVVSISNRTSGAKLRRVMLSASSFRREGRGILIERGGGRPMIAASAVPEDLIAQAQVVLQGKSREVIVRELQRTNLNVNEAVNNLLSRDDDDEDGEDSANEVMIPEELLSLLDPSSAANHAIVEATEGYPPDALEYIFSGRDRLRIKPESKEKEKKAKDDGVEKLARAVNDLNIADKFERYSSNDGYAPGGRRFVAIAANCSELLALSEDGILYGWKWDEELGDKNPHPIATSLLPDDEKIVKLSACSLRVAVATKTEMIASWLDHHSIGLRACQATWVKPLKFCSDRIVELSVSNHIAVCRTKTGTFYWCGLYPFSDRPKIWEKERAKSKKHVTFSTESCDIKEGSEVRTKASPVYAAGSVAVNLSLENPMVGVLMESVWSITEMCRFRVMDPAVYDRDLPGDRAEGEIKKQQKGSGRKRRASQDVFEGSPSREEAWEVGSLVWIHEQQNQDTCIVKIVDGAYVGVEYVRKTSDMTFATSQSCNLSSKEGDAENSNGKMRLMRKDDLCLLTPRMKSIRSPRVLQSEPARISLPSSNSRKILSVIADSNGLRALVEKRGRLFIIRISVSGKIGSERLIHALPNSLYSPIGNSPQLMNYGEDTVLLLKDGNGSVIPLVRDALMGFREPSPLHLPPMKHFSIGVSSSNLVGSQASKPEVVKTLTMVAFVSPVEIGGNQSPSLIQSILYCDANGVKSLLDLFEKNDSTFLERELLHSRTDCGGSVFHAAIRLSTAKKNKDDADPGVSHGIKLREDETRHARDESRDLDLRWHRMLRSRNEFERESGIPAQGTGNEETPSSVPQPIPDPAPSKDQDMPDIEKGTNQFGSPVEDEKLRQKGALACLKIMLEHDVVASLLPDLLSIRDASGLTPFQSAVNIRAYGAALLIWNAIKLHLGPVMDSEKLMRLIYPSGSRLDDSPLFILAYNDNCSFTFTGEQHINQDIYECRTCGLTGTLCCCAECAMSCHRSHECKLKRTSPTAYCDCWEKCPCKALISGNQEKREELFRELVKHTSLHENVNNRGEHILLYLARTIGRQNEQQVHSKRRRRCIESGDNPNMPEHDLPPPAFAKFALEVSLCDWKVIRGAIRVGLREADKLRAVYEEVLIAHSQHGSTHLDRLVFALFTKCGEQVITNLLPTVVQAANEAKSTRDSLVDKLIYRFVRSVIRLYLMCMLVSPTAAATAICGKILPDSSTSTPEKKSYISIGGLFSIVRGETTKDTKSHAISNLISRFRAVLFSLPSYAVQQALNVSESLIVPVRLGMCRPTMNLSLPNNMDPVEYIEKYLNSEADLTSIMARGEGKERPPHQRKKKVQHKNDKNKTEKSQESESDSDSDEDGHSSRRHNSQSGVEDAADAAPTPAPRRKIGISEVYMNDEADSGDSSSPSESDEEEEEDHVMVEDEDNVDEDETEDEERENANETSEGDQDQSAAADTEAEEAEPVLEDTFRIEDEDESREGARDESHDVENSENRESNSDEDMPQRSEIPSSGDEPVESSSDAQPANPNIAIGVGQHVIGGPSDPAFAARRNRALRRSLNAHPGFVIDRRFSDDEEDGFEDLDIVRRERVPPNDRVATVNSAYTRAPPSSQVNTGTAATPSEQPGTPTDSSSSQTAYQMVRMFNYTVRLIADLLPILDEEANLSQKNSSKLSVSEATLRFVMANVLTCLEATWVWMMAMMDRLEGQLLFQNGVLMATNMTEPRIPPSHTKKKENKKDKGEEGHSRRETMEYLLTSMRACSKEGGDNFPVIDMELLHNLAFVFDSFMVYKNALEQGKKVMRERNRLPSSSANFIERQHLKEFFERSNPRAFSGSLTGNAWDTLSANTSLIPLASNSALLTPWSENDALYAPYSPLTNWASYEEAAQRLGLDADRSNSLYNFVDTDLPSALSDLSDDEEEMPEDENDVPVNHPEGMEPITVSEMKEYLRDSIHKPGNYVLSRWKNVLYIMAKNCVSNITESFGGDDGNSFLLTTVAGHTSRFRRFKKIMDQYRAVQSRDLTMEVHREPNQLIRDTVFDLNQTYVRRTNLPKTKEDSSTPMSCGKVKIKFHDEPGEGTGVARSYYTAFAEALQTNQKLPFEELGYCGSDDYLFGSSLGVRPPGKKAGNLRDRERQSISRIAVIRERGTSTILGRKRPSKRQQLSSTAKPYIVEDTSKIDSDWEQLSVGLDRSGDDGARDKKFIADALYLKVDQLRSSSAVSRITGMLVDLPLGVVINMLGNETILKQYVDDAVAIMLQSGIPSDLALLSTNKNKLADVSDHPGSDEAPLFVKTSKIGGYMPNPGKLSPIRLNVFRNVGRMIGLCLLQGELFPLKLARHVIKYILGKSLSWLDLQFFDIELFDSLRRGLLDDNTDEYFDSMQLTFVANIPSGDHSQAVVAVDLKPNGSNISVTPKNVLEYIYRFVEVRMLNDDCTKCLQAMRQGVFDSLPSDSLDLINPEDLRLLMCGAEQVNVTFLQEMTTFSDESHSTKDTIDKFKEWFWSVVEDLSDADKQELIFFWTGSPSLPTMAEVVHPQPTVMIRPPDDLYLPTANTCISRLYVPLYSSKKVLKNKLSIAIKATNFGFV